jgi:hypothetical protein
MSSTYAPLGSEHNMSHISIQSELYINKCKLIPKSTPFAPLVNYNKSLRNLLGVSTIKPIASIIHYSDAPSVQS